MRRALAALAWAALMLSGCGLRRHAAESAAVHVNARYGALESRLEALHPAGTRAWEMRLAQLDRELSHGDATRALARAAALEDSLARLERDLDDMESALTEQWSALSAATPELLERLSRDPDEHVRREAARLATSWRAAAEAHDAGRLHEAVERARAVQSKAIPLTAGTR